MPEPLSTTGAAALSRGPLQQQLRPGLPAGAYRDGGPPELLQLSTLRSTAPAGAFAEMGPPPSRFRYCEAPRGIRASFVQQSDVVTCPHLGSSGPGDKLYNCDNQFVKEVAIWAASSPEEPGRPWPLAAWTATATSLQCWRRKPVPVRAGDGSESAERARPGCRSERGGDFTIIAPLSQSQDSQGSGQARRAG